MKGLMNTSFGVVECVEMEKPVCGDNDMLVKNIYSGVSNGTEMNVLKGGNYNEGFPCLSLNYQPVAEIVEVGKNITKFKVGDVIYSGTFPGYVEYHIVKEDDLVVKLEADFDLKAASYLGLGGVAHHDVMLSGLTPYSNVLVMGAGMLGQIIAQIAKARGARVTLVDINDERLAYAKEYGLDHVVNTTVAEQKEELWANVPYDVVFETTGADVFGDIIGTAFDTPCLMGERAKMMIIGGRNYVKYVHNAAQEKEIELQHVHHFVQEDLDMVTKMFAEGKVKVSHLITKTVKFEDAAEFLEGVGKNPQSAMGTVVEY